MTSRPTSRTLLSARVQPALWAMAHAVNDGYPTLYLALLPLLMTRWHFNVSQAGLLAGLLALTTQAFQPVLGEWADRRGGPWFIVAGLVAGSLGNALGLAWATSFAVFAGALMVGGLGNAAFHPHMAALVSGEADTGHQGRRMSVWMVSGMVGHALAPLAAVAAWRAAGRWGLAALSLPGLLAAFLLYASARTIPRPPQRPRAQLGQDWSMAWRQGRTFFWVILLRNLGAASLLTLLPIVWQHRGGAFGETGALLTVVYGTGLIGNLMGGSIRDRWGPRPVLVASLTVAGLAALGGGLWHSLGWPFWIAVAIWGFAVNGAGAAILLFGQALFPGRAAMASGLTMGLGNTVGAFGAWAVGALAQAHGLTIAIVAAAGCLLVATVPAAILGLEPAGDAGN
jgi:FSR family fosmidomycin resistance protein-like MFS transporter